MTELYFENCCGQERIIARIGDMREAHAEMLEFMKERNYTPHYYRYAIYPDNELGRWYVEIDVGSWSEFFKIYFETEEEAKSFLHSRSFEKPF